MDDLERAAARMFCVGFHGTSPSRDVLELIARGVGGVVLFSRNIETAAQTAELCADLKRAGDGPLLISIDQEGGRVARLRTGFTAIPSMRDVGATGDASIAGDIGRLLARELRAVNIDLDFAPVLDVDTNPANPVIADRSFGRTPDLVASMGVALIEGMQSAGVAACGKHFPGHGDTSLDSHLALPSLPHDLARLRAVELPPFAAAVRAGVASIMTAHVIFQAIDPNHPATMSRPVLQGMLREEFGFDGVIISDDLEMKAIADHFGVEAAVIQGVNAGVDMLLVCHNAGLQHRAIDALVRAVRTGQVSRQRLDESNRRIERLMKHFVRPPSESDLAGVIGCTEHSNIVARIAATPRAQSFDPTEAGPHPTLSRRTGRGGKQDPPQIETTSPSPCNQGEGRGEGSPPIQPSSLLKSHHPALSRSTRRRSKQDTSQIENLPPSPCNQGEGGGEGSPPTQPSSLLKSPHPALSRSIGRGKDRPSTPFHNAESNE